MNSTNAVTAWNNQPINGIQLSIAPNKPIALPAMAALPFISIATMVTACRTPAMTKGVHPFAITKAPPSIGMAKNPSYKKVAHFKTALNADISFTCLLYRLLTHIYSKSIMT